MFDLLPLSRDELWAIHDYVRQHNNLGREWDKGFVARVMQAILEAQDHPTGQAVLMCGEEDLWQIDRQIPSTLVYGGEAIGRGLLSKVMKLVVKMRRDDLSAGEAGPETAYCARALNLSTSDGFAAS